MLFHSIWNIMGEPSYAKKQNSHMAAHLSGFSWQTRENSVRAQWRSSRGTPLEVHWLCAIVWGYKRNHRLFWEQPVYRVTRPQSTRGPQSRICSSLLQIRKRSQWSLGQLWSENILFGPHSAFFKFGINCQLLKIEKFYFKKNVDVWLFMSTQVIWPHWASIPTSQLSVRSEGLYPPQSEGACPCPSVIVPALCVVS